MRYIRKAFALTALMLLFSTGVSEAQVVGTCLSPLGEAYLDINNVRARIFNNGNLFWRGSPHVYEVPKGGGASAIFTSGLWVGGLVGGQLRAAAARYGAYAFWSGPLDDNGNPPDDCSIYDHLYKVSRSDIDDYEATGVAAPDLRNWPTGLGAPTYASVGNGIDDDGDGIVDEDNNGVDDDGDDIIDVDEREVIQLLDQPLASRVNRVIDLAGGERPAILGDQSIWWVMNDRGNEHRRSGADTPPIGLEVHAMVFAFNAAGPIGDATFYKYDLFYKANEPLTDAYVGVFSDPDLGNFQDDWVGSDSIRGIGFVWNSDDDDEGGGGYGTPAPAAGYDFFQGPIVPSVGDTAYVSGRQVPDFRNLDMTRFMYYNNAGGVLGDPTSATDYYNNLQGKWKDGISTTLGGDGRNYSNIPIAFAFPGDVGESDEQCAFWSECNADEVGTDIEAADRRFLLSTGPFTINPGDYQQIVFGIVYAKGANNFNSVTKMKEADALAQAAFDINFEIPAPPAPPVVTATAADQSVILEWTNGPRSNNFLEGYAAEDPFTPDDDSDYLFEGYDVIQYDNPLDQIGRVITTYDVPNGITRVVDGLPGEPSSITATGTDAGVSTSHTVTGLTNYKTYYFGIQAYAFNEPSFPKVYRGPITRVTVTPTKPTVDVQDAAIALLGGSGPDFVADKEAVGDGQVFARVTNPIRMVNAEYMVNFYEHDFGKTDPGSIVVDEEDVVDPLVIHPDGLAKTAAAGITYNISRDGDVLFDGSTLSAPAPLRNAVFGADGLSFDVLGPPPGLRDFYVIANANGWLDPPDYAAWGWAGFPDPRGYVVGFRGYQQVNGAVWGYHAGGAAQPYGPASSGSSFLGRATRGGSLMPLIGSYDYEQRFEQRCFDQMDGTIDVANDCLAFREYSDDAIMEVPFTLWRAGIGTERDYSDDIQMVPIICDTNTCGGGNEHGVYDIGGDHAASSAANDPFTDWIYWNLDPDLSPGSAGYLNYFNALNDGTHGPYSQILARTVLAAWNEGTAPPYARDMPEPGTIFKIEANKQNQIGDKYTFSTDGYGATQPEGDRARERMEDIGIVPNPYLGASDYEVSQLTNEVRFTNMPDVATIRVFTLNGTLIKTIEKNSPGVATISWDMVTEYNLPIASGLYLVHVTVPDVGETVIKFAVVKKRIQLNTY